MADNKRPKWIGPAPEMPPVFKIGRPPVHGAAKGGRHSPTYKTWARVRQAALKGRYEHSPSWKDFRCFLKDMGERPDGAELRRKDAALGYTKANCYWYTPKENNDGTRDDPTES